VEVACFGDKKGYILYTKSSLVMFYDGLFQRFVDVMYVFYDGQCVVVSSVLILLSCRHRLSLYVVSSSSCLRAFLLYPMALIMSGLLFCGLPCFGSGLVGIIVGSSIVVLYFCNPSCVASRACRAWSSCGVVISISVYVLEF
jgi:hypothetical protein